MDGYAQHTCKFPALSSSKSSVESVWVLCRTQIMLDQRYMRWGTAYCSSVQATQAKHQYQTFTASQASISQKSQCEHHLREGSWLPHLYFTSTISIHSHFHLSRQNHPRRLSNIIKSPMTSRWIFGCHQVLLESPPTPPTTTQRYERPRNARNGGKWAGKCDALAGGSISCSTPSQRGAA